MKLMKLRSTFVTLLLCLILAITLNSISSSCAPTAKAEKVFKMAYVTGYSGPGAAWGWQGVLGYELAAEDINAAGGIKVGGESYKVEIVRYDNEYNPTVSNTVVRKAIYDDGIKFMQVSSTDESLAVTELCNSEKVILFAEGPMRNLGSKNPYTFQTHFEYSDNDEGNLSYIREKYPEWKRIGLCTPDSARGKLQSDSCSPIYSQYGFTLVDTLYFAEGTSDFYSAMTKLLAEGVDIIDCGCMPPEDQANMIKQARELGFKGIFLHPDSISTAAMSEICGIEALEGSVAGSQLVNMPTQRGEHYKERFMARYGSFIFWPAILCYNPMMILKAAIEEADSFDTEKVLEALETVRVEGLLGDEIGFFSNNYTQGIPRAIKLQVFTIQIQNGEEVDVGTPMFGSIWK